MNLHGVGREGCPTPLAEVHIFSWQDPNNGPCAPFCVELGTVRPMYNLPMYTLPMYPLPMYTLPMYTLPFRQELGTLGTLGTTSNIFFFFEIVRMSNYPCFALIS